MHDLELGWGIIRGNPWEKNRTGGTRQRQLLERGVRAMRARLHSWYDRNPARTRVGNLTVGMVLGTKGTIYRPCLRAKGAESRTLAFFARDELQCWVHTIDTTEARLLLGACNNLCSFYNVLERGGRVLTVTEGRELVGHVLNYNTLFSRSGRTLAPKNHLWLHLAQQAARNGNPKFFSTYPDESLNGIIAKICRTAHPNTLAIMVFKKWRALCLVQD